MFLVVQPADWPWSSRHKAPFEAFRYSGVASQLPLGFINTLYFGDNLEVLRRHVATESVDLIYLDPPFNSNRSYNVLFEHKDGTSAAGQVKAFDDSWTWSIESARVYEELVARGGEVSRTLRALRSILGTNDLLAYLTMMSPRLVELHRALRSTGTLYLHCDPTASHYLKVLLDSVFGPEQFVNEIVWRRYGAHNDQAQGTKHFGRVHDTILMYAKTSGLQQWNQMFGAYDPEYVAAQYRHDDGDGRGLYRTKPLTAPGGAAKGNPQYEWNGHTRFWRYNQDRMHELEADNRLHYSGTGYVSQKHYMAEAKGAPIQDLWTDVKALTGSNAEREGYPTQKPRDLLERIISASSEPDDVVLDPFCGCGTTIDAAQKLGRRWIGIDITEVAVKVMVDRLNRVYGQLDYVLIGEPSTIDEATALASLDKHEFEEWVCRRIGATGAHRKGADRGIDGEFVGVFDNGDSWRGIVSVKGGSVGVAQVRDLWGVIQREKAEFGVYVSLKKPTPAMKREGADAGFTSEGVPRLQVVTVDEIFEKGAAAIQLPATQKAEERKRRLRAV